MGSELKQENILEQVHVNCVRASNAVVAPQLSSRVPLFRNDAFQSLVDEASCTPTDKSANMRWTDFEMFIIWQEDGDRY